MNLRFWQREPPKELLASKYANVGELGMAWDSYDLPPELLNQPLGVPNAGPGVDVAYESENPRSEAHLYARDPREIKESIVASAESGLLQLAPSLWSTLTTPELLPQSVVIGPKPYTENYTARYEYALANGVLALNERSIHGHTTGYKAKTYAKKVDDALIGCPHKAPYDAPPYSELPLEQIPETHRCKSVPDGLYLAAREEQTQYILEKTGLSACQVGDAQPCADAAFWAGEGVRKGADTLEALGIESFSKDDRDAMKAAISERVNKEDSSSPLKHWTCVPDAPGSDEGYCAFTIPAKRLNTYPDAVELVWFDEKEVNNPAYALYVAAHMQTGTDPSNGLPTFNKAKVDELCSYHPATLGDRREFTLSNQGFGDEWEFIPSICTHGFDWHVDCSFHGPAPRRGAWAAPLVVLALAVVRRRGRTTTSRS